MKYLKVAATLMLLLAFVASTTFAAGGAGRLPLPQRATSNDDQVKIGKTTDSKLSNSHRRVSINEGQAILNPKKLQETRTHVYHQSMGKKNYQLPARLSSYFLSGPIYLGPGGDFTALSDLNDYLNTAGARMDGPVEIILTGAPTDTASLHIPTYAGMNATNTFTIHPDAGVTDCQLVLAGDETSGGGLVIDGGSYVTINGTATGELAGSKNLTIKVVGVSGMFEVGPVVLLNAKSCTVENCVIIGNSTSAVWADAAYGNNGSVEIFSTPGNYSEYVKVDNCELTGGHFGVYELGNMPTTLDNYGIQDAYTTVSHCYIHDVTENGVNLQQVTGALVDHNVIKRVVLGSAAGASPNILAPDGSGNLANAPLLWRPSGIQVWGDYATISNNVVDSIWNNRTSTGTFSAGVYGIRVFGFGNNDPATELGGNAALDVGLVTGSKIVNNTVTRVFSKAKSTNMLNLHEFGIETFASRQDTVMFNTVYMSGADPANGGGQNGSACVMVGGVYMTAAGYPGFVDALLSAYTYAGRVAVKDNILANDRTGTTGSFLVVSAGPNGYDYRGIVGTTAASDYNVLYKTNGQTASVMGGTQAFDAAYQFNVWNSTDAHSQVDNPGLVSASVVSIDPAKLSTADGNGVAVSLFPTDLAGVTRTNPPDIGALEGTGAGQPLDVMPLALVSPGPAGIPASVPTDISVSVLNLGSTAAVVPFTVHVVAPDASTEDFTGSVNVPGLQAATGTASVQWNPSIGGDYTFIVSTGLVGDNYPANDVMATLTIPVAPLLTMPYTSGMETAPDRLGWFATGDFSLGSNAAGNVKLGGAHAGDKAYVTKPGGKCNPAAEFAGPQSTGGAAITPTCYSTATTSHLYTPYFNLETVDTVSVSFFHSIQCEPGWDQSNFEYSIDTGKSWHVLGILNDPAGLNWYNTSLYANAITHWVNDTCFDTTTAKKATSLYPEENPGHPSRCWSSNGECGATGSEVYPQGPDGYVFVSLDLTGSPVLHHKYVRFRYTTWSDAVMGYDGWAFDDFMLTKGLPAGEATYTGKVYSDLNGNGVLDGAEVGTAGLKVYMNFSGTVVESSLTDAGGNFTLHMGAIGDYTPSVTVPGLFSQAPTRVPYLGSGVPATFDIGYYNGSINGTVWNDKNDNGTNDAGEVGLVGWTVEIHKDSLTGARIDTVLSKTGGVYTYPTLPGTYYVKENVSTGQAGYRQTGATQSYVVTVGGVSGSTDAIQTGKDFYNYGLHKLSVYFQQDMKGDGTGLLIGMPAGVNGIFKVVKVVGGVDNIVSLDTLGQNPLMIHLRLDKGDYRVDQTTTLPAGYFQTSPLTKSFTVNTGSLGDTARFLGFKAADYTGKVFEDINGNGTQNAGDLPVGGWSAVVNTAAPETVVTGVDGKFTFVGLGPGAHTVSVIQQAGWVATGRTTRSFSLTSGIAMDSSNVGMGEFKTVSASGLAYRDYNNNGTNDGSDKALAGVTINIAKGGVAFATTTTDENGAYSFSDLGPGTYLVTSTEPTGYGRTEPVTDNVYTFTSASQVNHSGYVYGFFHLTDAVPYRTITAAEIASHWTEKPSTFKKADTVAKRADLLVNLMGEGVITIGVPNVLDVDGKSVKGFIQPKKYSDVFATFNGKGGAATGTKYTGFDRDLKGKLIQKRQVSIAPSKQNNPLTPEIYALTLNVLMSENGHTPAGLGSMIIDWTWINANLCTICPSCCYGLQQVVLPFDPETVQTVAKFAEVANGLMTKWDGVDYKAYSVINYVASTINGEFAGVAFNYDRDAFLGSTHKVVLGPSTKTVYETAFLKPATVVAPKMRRFEDVPVVLPAAYALYQNYPNPFNPTTTIRFDLPASSVVTVTIYNMLGQQVGVVSDHEVMEAGTQEVTFNANSVASGVYFYHVVAQGQNDNGLATGQTFTKTMKMVLVK